MAKAVLEMAILDAELRLRGLSFATYLGAVRERVPSGVAVGIIGSVAPSCWTPSAAYVDQGYLRIKLKIQPGWDLAPVRAVRERFGDDLALQVDGNAAYTLADAVQLGRLDPFGLLLIEQPLAVDDLAGHAELARRIGTPVCLDESITSARAAADAISRGACSVVNVKAGRVGGYLEARRVHDVCAAHDVPVWCGGMLETGLGRAANVALAALPNFSLPGDISASDRYWREDITSPFRLQDGHLAVPTGPGLGVTPESGCAVGVQCTCGCAGAAAYHLVPTIPVGRGRRDEPAISATVAAGPLAHLVEQEPFKLLVRGSRPRRPTSKVLVRGAFFSPAPWSRTLDGAWMARPVTRQLLSGAGRSGLMGAPGRHPSDPTGIPPVELGLKTLQALWLSIDRFADACL